MYAAYPVLAHQEYLKQRKLDAAAGHAEGTESRRFLRRWLGTAIRHWQQRKMISSLEAMNDDVLRELGVCRHDIPRLVEGLSDRELRLASLASSASLTRADDEIDRKAA